ncbi:MAG: Phosphoesterase [Acidimicrobiaceae bacterium]|nr:Phosphoesterase [Acidimicrobiaceae bacterium]
MIVAVLSDTHLRSGVSDHLPAAALELIEGADVLLHAGDVIGPAVLSELGAMTETLAVLGNNDVELATRLPETLEVSLAGVRVAMVHDSGARSGRAARLHQRFPDADVVVFGHSHLPLNEFGEGGQLLFNPGSPTLRRQAPNKTMGRLVLKRGQVVSRELLAW